MVSRMSAFSTDEPSASVRSSRTEPRASRPRTTCPRSVSRQDRLRSSPSAAGLAAISVADDVLFVTDAAQELTRSEVEFLRQARELWERVDRPNVMIKIPATEPGLPAITATIAEGISVNVTLIFALERYGAVIDAYLGVAH